MNFLIPLGRRGLAKLFGFFDGVFFWSLWVFGVALFKVYFRLAAENPPQLKGAYIIAANHSSLLDGVVLQGVARRRLCYLLTVIFFKNRVLHWFFRWLHVIPIYEGGGNKDALSEGVNRLRKGKVMGIFPEGEISRTGKLGKGKPGVAVLSQGAQVPVVPAAIIGSFEAMPRGVFFPKPKKIVVRFGTPIDPLPSDQGPRRKHYRLYTEKVMAAIASLQNQANISQKS